MKRIERQRVSGRGPEWAAIGSVAAEAVGRQRKGTDNGVGGYFVNGVEVTGKGITEE